MPYFAPEPLDIDYLVFHFFAWRAAVSSDWIERLEWIACAVRAWRLHRHGQVCEALELRQLTRGQDTDCPDQIVFQR